MPKLILIKLGGSLITDKSQEFTAKPETILRLAKEIESASSQTSNKMIISHGAGSFAHRPASQYQTALGMINKDSLKGLSLTADAAVSLNRIVIQEFLKTNLNSISFSPESLFYSQGRKLKTGFTTPISKALDLGMLPILYGDVIFDNSQGFCIFSAEKVIGALVTKLHQEYQNIQIIYCGNTNGVYDASGKNIPKITPKNFQKVAKFITGSDQIDVTGGMIHKVKESLDLAKKGIQTYIIDGTKDGELKNTILGKNHSGTLISKN